MDNRQIVAYDQKTALMVADQEEEVKRVSRKLMRLTPGGKRLTQDEAVDLAVYSLLTGLNPFNSECYYLPDVGPIPGVAGYRVKTIEWLRATSDPRHIVRVTEDYRDAQPGEADFNKDAGDIAVWATLTDSVSKERWEQRFLEMVERYHKMVASFVEAREAAKEDIGPCPSWSAVGVVKGSEHFSGIVWEDYNKKITKKDPGGNTLYKPEMWDRYERAKKRAIKGCYRKGFPNVHIPDPEYGDIIDTVAIEVKQQIAAELQAENSLPPKTAAQLVTELGCLPEYSKDDYWNLVHKLEWDETQGNEVLTKFEGNFTRAYTEAAKNLPPE